MSRFPGLGRGMLAQVNRVNGTEDSRVRDLQHQLVDLQNEIERLRRLLATAGLSDGAQHVAPIEEGTNHPRATLMHDGRPATTARLCAEYYGVHISTITRHLESGKLAGHKHGATRWVVYLDQPIGPFKSHKHRGV